VRVDRLARRDLALCHGDGNRHRPLGSGERLAPRLAGATRGGRLLRAPASASIRATIAATSSSSSSALPAIGSARRSRPARRYSADTT
jgi:hypothetical protein